MEICFTGAGQSFQPNSHPSYLPLQIIQRPLWHDADDDNDDQVRGDMIVLILATDMARHAEILDNFRQKLDNFDYSSEVKSN